MRDSGYNRIVNDYYVEPKWIVEALLNHEAPFTGVSWDPSCGGGNIPKTMNDYGSPCRGTDLVCRGYGYQTDFFLNDLVADNIISNPPFGIIEPYIERALAKTTGRVCLLARLALLEGQKRRALLESTPLARVWVSSRRVSMPPGGTEIKATGGTIAYAWFVWEHGHVGPATIGWL
jgi:hypothetical protein